jgi:hypothetical protein
MGEKVSSNLRSALFEALLRRNIGFFDREENSVGMCFVSLLYSPYHLFERNVDDSPR